MTRIIGVMQIVATCPGCSSSFLLDGSAADRRVRCPRCRQLFKVPHLDEVPQAVKVITGAQGTVYVDEHGKTYG